MTSTKPTRGDDPTEFTTWALAESLREIAKADAREGEFHVAEHINSIAADRLNELREERDWFAIQIVKLLHQHTSVEQLQESMILHHSELYSELLTHLLADRDKPLQRGAL